MAKILATPVTGIIYALRHKTATLRSLMTLWFCHFLFSISLKTTPVTVGAVRVVMSFDSLGLSPDILRAVAEQGYREPTLFSSRRSLRCWKAAT